MGQGNVSGRHKKKKGPIPSSKRFDPDMDTSFIIYNDNVYDVDALWEIADTIKSQSIHIERLDLGWLTDADVRYSRFAAAHMAYPILVVIEQLGQRDFFHVLVGRKRVVKAIVDGNNEIYVRPIGANRLTPALRNIKDYTPRKTKRKSAK